jgi:hypothetical protein
MELDLEYVFVETDFAKTYRQELQKKYRHSTFPIVIGHDGPERLMIGGYDDLLQHVEPKP